MRDPGLIELRRHHPDIIRTMRARSRRNVESVGMNTVVVGDQNAHDQARSIVCSRPCERSTSGTAIEPSCCWYVSMMAIRARPTATPIR